MLTSLLTLTLCRAHVECRIEATEERLARFDPVSEPAPEPSASTLASSTSTSLEAALEPEDEVDVFAETLIVPGSDDLWEGLDEPSTLQLATLTSTASTSDSTDAPACTPSAPTGRLDNTATPYYAEAISVLKNVFQLSTFRKNQLEAINATLDGKDVFVLMPTGGGKSLCYQLPAVCKSGRTQGVTFVISPLVALIADQVASLREKNISVDCMTSLRSAEDSRDVMRRLRSQLKPDICYITPEKLRESNAMQDILAQLYEDKQIARFVIDEAHVIQSWGRDFRDAVSVHNLICACIINFFLLRIFSMPTSTYCASGTMMCPSWHSPQPRTKPRSRTFALGRVYVTPCALYSLSIVQTCITKSKPSRPPKRRWFKPLQVSSNRSMTAILGLCTASRR